MDIFPWTRLQRTTLQGLMSDNNSASSTLGTYFSCKFIPEKICCQVTWTDLGQSIRSGFEECEAVRVRHEK